MNGAGYRDVRECADMEALETNICTSVPPDLVITDTKMPGGNIFDLMSKMRKKPDIKVICNWTDNDCGN